jgi:hypothetical protein
MDFLEWAEKHPATAIGLALALSLGLFPICSCFKECLESDHRFTLEKARMIHQQQEKPR